MIKSVNKKSKKPSAKPAKPVAEKAAAKGAKPAAPAPKAEPKKVDLNKENVKQAITQGRAIILEGKSKADAARAIFAFLKNEDKEVIVAAFIQGATLTEKGAQTYWYNCKRKAGKGATS